MTSLNPVKPSTTKFKTDPKHIYYVTIVPTLAVLIMVVGLGMLIRPMSYPHFEPSSAYYSNTVCPDTEKELPAGQVVYCYDWVLGQRPPLKSVERNGSKILDFPTPAEKRSFHAIFGYEEASDIELPADSK
jgi:hypothetical protein